MKESYVSYEIARKLKACGFDWECNSFYLNGDDGVITASERNWNKSVETSAPTLSMAQKWLREVKGIAVNVIAHDGGKYHWEEVYLPNFKEEGRHWYAYREYPLSPTYESALSAGIDASLKLLTEKQ